MDTFSILSGDKRQFYIEQYLKKQGYDTSLKANMNFHDAKYIVGCTPFTKNGEYINCDFYSSFPTDTFFHLLRPGQIVFAGSINKDIIEKAPEDVTFVDVLKDENVVWNNAMLTAEGLIAEMIKNTDFVLNGSKILIFGFGKCGTNLATRLHALNCDVTIYDHTPKHLSQAESYGYHVLEYNDFSLYLKDFDIIINTVPENIMTDFHMSILKKTCVLFEIASFPYGFDKKLTDKYNLSLVTCPGIPGITAPKTAGELIAQSIISYLKQKGLG